LSWAEWWWRLALVARIGEREHRAANPWRISLTTTWPRSLLQCLFFTVLGRVLGGEPGQAYAFIGSIAIVIALFTLGEMCDVPMRDRWSATFYRLRSGRIPVPMLYAVRAWPIVAEAALVGLCCTIVVGLLTGQGELTLQLLTLFPVYLLLVFTSAAAGLAAAAVGLFGRAGADVIIANLGLYLIIAASGALIPPGRLGWLDTLGAVLPMSHGLRAIRGQLAGQPWLIELLLEVVIGACWAAAGIVAYSVLVSRVRRTDHDKVT